MTIKVRLSITEGPEAGHELELIDGRLRLGRSKADFLLSDKKVSGSHCEFYVENSQLYLEDLGSTNGTFVGSEKINTPIILENLDVVTIGLSKIKISIVESLEDFKENNQFKSAARTPTSAESAAQPQDVLPPEEAEYHTTGIHRIENMINDEMEAFSKWDHPQTEETGDSKFVPKIQVVLVARKAPEGVTQINCSAESTTIGRKGVDVRLNDLDLSRKHAAIEILGGKTAYVRDLASTNGTYLNGNKIEHQEINSGDLIQIGQSVFEVQIQQVKS